MKVNIESMDFRNFASLEEYAQQKLNKSLGKYPFVTAAHIYFKDAAKEKQSKMAKIQLHVKNDILFAQSLGNRFDAALDNALQKIQRQIRKYKTRKYKR